MAEGTSAERSPQIFPDTRWSLMARFQAGESDAIGSFCEAYWYPVYGFIRHWGRGQQDAEDLAQEFFMGLLERGSLENTRAEKGKLRSYLLVLLKRFLADDHDFRTAAKRGGKAAVFSIDADRAEDQLAGEFSCDLTPDHFFDRQWALVLLEGVLGDLAVEYERSGKGEIFSALRGTLSLAATGQEPTYSEIARRLDRSENAVKIAAYRLRQRYRLRLHERILETVDSPEEVEEEIGYLCAVVGR